MYASVEVQEKHLKTCLTVKVWKTALKKGLALTVLGVPCTIVGFLPVLQTAKIITKILNPF